MEILCRVWYDSLIQNFVFEYNVALQYYNTVNALLCPHGIHVLSQDNNIISENSHLMLKEIEFVD